MGRSLFKRLDLGRTRRNAFGMRPLDGTPGLENENRSALHSPDNRVFYEADAAAQELGIDTREIHFDRVRSEPLKSSSWYRLLQQTNDDQIEEILSFAAGALPLDEIATGPADSLGLGEKYAAHHALDWILQDLKRFPGHGWEFIKIGLQSPVTRNRNMALNALLEWPRPSWPEQAPSCSPGCEQQNQMKNCVNVYSPYLASENDRRAEFSASTTPLQLVMRHRWRFALRQRACEPETDGCSARTS